MTLTKNQKILLGIAHFLPIIGIITYFVCFFSFIFGTIKLAETHPNGPPPEFFAGMLWAMLALILTIFVSITVKVLDIIHLVKNNKGDTGNKILMWILLFIFVGMLSEIIYFFMEIVPEKRKEIQQTNGI